MIHDVAKLLTEMQPELLKRNGLGGPRMGFLERLLKGWRSQQGMATVDGLVGYHGGYNAGSQILDQDTVVTRFIDTTAFPVPTVGLVNADTYEIITIPALTVLKEVTIVVHTVEGAADTVSVKDGATTFITTVSTNSAVATAGTGVPKYYATLDTLDVLANAAITVAKFFVIARYQKLDIRY